ncbi:MAG TPA: hypothetical protein VF663_14730 [Telluria sp.]
MKADPIESILFRMDQMQLTRKDLIPYIGSISKVSEVLSRKRPLLARVIFDLMLAGKDVGKRDSIS